MMKTDDLIASLGTGLAPVRPGAVARTLAIGLLAGAAGTALLMLATIGLRHDLGAAMAGGAFWMKFTYTLIVAALGAWIVERAGRPGTSAVLPLILLALPLAGIVGLAAAQMAPADADRHHLVMGHSANVCALLIAGLALPLFAGVFWALRQLAPTRLALAGAAAGLLAGATSASIYAFHCTESAAPFVALWYTAGILLTTVIGAALGRLFLRW
jgi:hypothetical protein